MVIKITNKEENFYQYMGKYFGSRIIEKQTNDRIYDDNDKIWYLYIENEKVLAFVSLSKNIIKNIYAIKDQYLKEILEKIKEENTIGSSIVPKTYIEVYKKCGFQISENQSYKNFVIISVVNNQKLSIA